MRRWLTALAERSLVPGRVITPSSVDHSVWRLELALAVAVMAHHLDLMLTMWPQAAAELDMYDAITAELRKPPSDLTVVVPESPMGNVLGFQYVEDDQLGGLDDASTSLLIGMREVLAPYFDPASTDPDRHLVKALYQPLHQALHAMGDR